MLEGMRVSSLLPATAAGVTSWHVGVAAAAAVQVVLLLYAVRMRSADDVERCGVSDQGTITGLHLGSW